MTRKIFGILGLGIFGKTLACELSSFEQEVIALDNQEKHVQDVADYVTKGAVGDITDFEFLKAAGIDQCDIVIIATGNNLEASALALIHCQKLGVTNIIAKARGENYEDVLYGLGAKHVISPERSTAKNLTSRLLRHSIANIIHIEDDISFIEFTLPESWLGKSLTQLDVRKKYDLNVIGFRTSKTAPLDTDFNPDHILTKELIVEAVASKRTFEKFDYLGYLK
ncbi:potassium channel family protein [Streptococcus pantholopis]|uniref:Potassium transporter Trk n=1 Tax=Streptococcus pantholopis TaxID=1811193 RepID=A0A172Q5K6_9STRE|nr:TrkA family potassium uptake protein [Streptococcus pantholopis]AND78728.1 potassium transporter Trk [Streptococcus pantholopis]